MGRLLALLAGAAAGWFALRFLRRRRASRRDEVDPASQLRDRLSEARADETPAAEAAESAERTPGPVTENASEPDTPAPANGGASLQDERRRVHDRARQAAERMRPDRDPS